MNNIEYTTDDPENWGYAGYAPRTPTFQWDIVPDYITIDWDQVEQTDQVNFHFTNEPTPITYEIGAPRIGWKPEKASIPGETYIHLPEGFSWEKEGVYDVEFEFLPSVIGYESFRTQREIRVAQPNPLAHSLQILRSPTSPGRMTLQIPSLSASEAKNYQIQTSIDLKEWIIFIGDLSSHADFQDGQTWILRLDTSDATRFFRLSGH